MERDAVEEPAIVCWGEVLWDLFPDGPRLGGAPANIAHHLAALGRPVTLVTRVGDDPAGRRAVHQLADAGVDVSAVQVDPSRPTGAVEVELDGPEARYRLRTGCAWRHIEFDAAARAAVATARAICFGTLSQRGSQARAAFDQALRTRTAGCLAVCDINLRDGEQDVNLVRWAASAADVVKLNEREATQVANLVGRGDAIDWLLGEIGVRQVALTRGAAGCVLITREGRVEQAGFPATPGGDNVGCGDAFTAVWTHELLRGRPLPEIAAAACRRGAATASHPGAAPSPNATPAILIQLIFHHLHKQQAR